MRCDWAKSKDALSYFDCAWCIIPRMNRRIYSACLQSVLIYGTETWAMNADDFPSLERTERPDSPHGCVGCP